MLIHRVAMVGIANHQRIDAVELRHQHLQDAQGVHDAQRLCSMATEQDSL